MQFNFTGDITPDMFQTERTVPCAYNIDKDLLKAILKSMEGDPEMNISVFMVNSLMEYLEDLDSVLLALMDLRTRKVEHSFINKHVQLKVSIDKRLTEAGVFLKSKGFPRITHGNFLVACALLKADKEHLIPAVD